MMVLHYRPADDMFVILGPDGAAIAETNATTMVARQTRDEAAAGLGVLRFLDWRDWQVKACGTVLSTVTAETAMASAPRL